MWHSVARYGCSRGGAPFGLEAADLVQSILNDIAIQSEANPSWLDTSAAL
jgi:hypothetical protein